MNIKLINILFTLFLEHPRAYPLRRASLKTPQTRFAPPRFSPFALDTSGSFGPCRAASGKRGKRGKRGSFGPCRVVLDC